MSCNRLSINRNVVKLRVCVLINALIQTDAMELLQILPDNSLIYVSDQVITTVLLGFKSNNIYKHVVKGNIYQVTFSLNALFSEFFVSWPVQSYDKVKSSSQFLNENVCFCRPFIVHVHLCVLFSSYCNKEYWISGGVMRSIDVVTKTSPV